MTHVYAPEPVPGPITLELAEIVSPVERMRRRALAHKVPVPGDSFTLDGIQVQLLAPIDLVGNGLGIEMKLRARVVATNELLPMDSVYRFINPPLKIFNETWRVVTTPEGDVDVLNFEENPMEMLKRIVLDAVLFRARKYGWTG
jgi:hypothetical protein